MTPPLARKPDSSAALVGAALGLIAGLVAAGPNFSQWAASRSLLIILACGLGGLVVGRIVGALFGSRSRRSGGDAFDGCGGDGFGVDCSDGGCDGGGGDGGGGD